MKTVISDVRPFCTESIDRAVNFVFLNQQFALERSDISEQDHNSPILTVNYTIRGEKGNKNKKISLLLNKKGFFFFFAYIIFRKGYYGHIAAFFARVCQNIPAFPAVMPFLIFGEERRKPMLLTVDRISKEFNDRTVLSDVSFDMGEARSWDFSVLTVRGRPRR